MKKGVVIMTKFYKIVLKDGRKYWKESARDYMAIWKEALKKHGDNLACVLEEYGVTSVEDLKRIYKK
jgi:hypothetical protein